MRTYIYREKAVSKLEIETIIIFDLYTIGKPHVYIVTKRLICCNKKNVKRVKSIFFSTTKVKLNCFYYKLLLSLWQKGEFQVCPRDASSICGRKEYII